MLTVFVPILIFHVIVPHPQRVFSTDKIQNLLSKELFFCNYAKSRNKYSFFLCPLLTIIPGFSPVPLYCPL